MNKRRVPAIRRSGLGLESTCRTEDSAEGEGEGQREDEDTLESRCFKRIKEHKT